MKFPRTPNIVLQLLSLVAVRFRNKILVDFIPRYKKFSIQVPENKQMHSSVYIASSESISNELTLTSLKCGKIR